MAIKILNSSMVDGQPFSYFPNTHTGQVLISFISYYIVLLDSKVCLKITVLRCSIERPLKSRGQSLLLAVLFDDTLKKELPDAT